MKTHLWLLLILASIPGVSAQTLVMKSGQTFPADGLVRNADMIMVPIKSPTGAAGQIGLHVSDVASLNLPEPAALETAGELIKTKQFDRALSTITPVVDYQKTLHDIPGNWWAKSALVEVSVLFGLKREVDAKALATEITTATTDPEILNAAKLEIAMATDYKDPLDAIPVYEAIIHASSDPGVLAQAWMAEGDGYFAGHQFDDALLAYVTVTVFYPDHDPLVPKAMWGSGQAYLKLKDLTSATKTFQKLISTYPDSPEAALAKAELMKEDPKT